MTAVPAQSCDSVGFHRDNKSGRDSEFRAIPTSCVPALLPKAQRLNLIQETLLGSCSRAIPVVWISGEKLQLWGGMPRIRAKGFCSDLEPSSLKPSG